MRDGIKDFFHSCLKRQEGFHIEKEIIYQAYLNFCVWNNYTYCTKINFFRLLYSEVPNMRPKLKTNNGKLVQCLVGRNLSIPKRSVYMDEFMRAMGQAFHMAARDKANCIDLWGNFNGKDIVVTVRQANAQDIAKREIAMKNKSMGVEHEEKADPLDDENKDIPLGS